jgi:hypothetical protein
LLSIALPADSAIAILAAVIIKDRDDLRRIKAIAIPPA